MKFSIATLFLLALFSFVSADANAIPSPDNVARDAAAEPNKLIDAINAAAKAKQAAALKLQNLAGFGLVGQAKPKNWAQQCKAKNPKIERVIRKFCERGHGGKGGVTVPNKYPSGGMCTSGDPKWNYEDGGTGQGMGYKPTHNQWCAKIGSKKKKCKQFVISKDMCMGKLFQVCAKGDGRGKGKAAENGGCQVYRTGKVNYSNSDVMIARSPFKSGWTDAGFW